MDMKEISDLRRALRRVGGRLDSVTDVEGMFVPDPAGAGGSRLYGTLVAADASIAVGFDAHHVPLPQGGQCRIKVSGRPWLDERSGSVTLMVRRYEYLSEGLDVGVME